MTQPVVVVSIDGVAPRFITPSTMPTVCSLARQGASCFDARTVVPSITLPAHASLLRGIDPSVHGIVDNTPKALSDDWPTFLKVARDNGHVTAAAINWAPVAGLLEPDAVHARYYLDGGYDLDDDRRIRHAATSLFAADEPSVMFVYFVAPDLAGHDHGWGSQPYFEALRASDQHLADLIDTIGDAALLVTTDHGGHGNDHQLSEPIDQITFITLRANGVEAASTLASASILDVAPTVAALAGFDPAPTWAGTSLVGRERPTIDALMHDLARLAKFSYGENVNMLEHALQTAAHASAGGATDQLALAALLHDIGHLSDNAGPWGDADHAELGALRLQGLLPEAIVEPVRLHVAAKRWLVANEDGYAEQLSTASQITLEQQGGPLTQPESADFTAAPWAAHALQLRRCDDWGKEPGRSVPDLESYRDRLAHALITEPVSAAAVRNSCSCEACRDSVSGQSLLDAPDLADWRVVGSVDGQPHLERNGEGETHVVSAFDRPEPELAREHWNAERATELLQPHPVGDVDAISRSVATTGVALVEGVPTTDRAVLAFAATLGHVRATNYGEHFEVVNKPNANNLAYTARRLPLHTDNPYRDPVPTVQILHCLTSAAPQGASYLCDGYDVAERLRTVDPTSFECLTNTLVRFRFTDATVDLAASHPVIECDVAGTVRALHVNHRSMTGPVDQTQVAAFYDAYAALQSALDAEGAVAELVLRDGDALVFDNRRVLHARGSFDPALARRLQGCYIDIDALESTARLGRS